MLGLISRLFNIRPHEWPRLLWLYGMGMVFLIGLTWGETTADALFLKRVGVDFLPILFVIEALVTVFALAFFSAFADRIPNDRLLIGVLVTGALAVGVTRLLVAADQTSLAYPLFYLCGRVIRDVFNVQFWTYVAGFYDTRAAKRIVPFLATAARVAGAAAGLTMPIVNRFLAPVDVSFAWIASLILMSVMVWAMPRFTKDRDDTGHTLHLPILPMPKKEGPKGIRAYLANIRDGYRFVAKSAFLRWMAASTLILIIFTTLITYQSRDIFNAQFPDEKSISNYVGTLVGITNLVMLPIQLIFLGRLVGWLGLATANLIYPLAMVGVAGALIALPSALFSAAAAQFSTTTFRTAFRNTLDNLMYNAVPVRVKGRARAFIGGVVMPIGTMIGGGLLLIRPLLPQIPWLLPTMIGIGAALYLFSAFVLRRQYARALIQMLEQEDYSFLLASAPDLSVKDTATLSRLQKRLQESDNPEFRLFMAQLMAEIGGSNAVPILAQIAETGDAATREAIINILVATDQRSPDMRNLLNKYLNDPDGRVRRAAIAGLKHFSDGPQYANLALAALRDPDRRVRMEAAPALIGSSDVFYVASAMRALAPALVSTDPAVRAQAVTVLGRATDIRFVDNLLDYFVDPSDEVRLAAALTAEELVALGRLPAPLAATLRTYAHRLLSDPVERIRRVAVVLFSYLQVPETPQILIAFLSDPSPDIRGAAGDALAKMGKAAVPLLSPLLNGSDHGLRRMAARVLAKIDRERATEMIRGFIAENLMAIHTNYVRLESLSIGAEYRSIALLISLLRERNDALTDEIFQLLAALHAPETVRVVAESLRSADPRIRANALEALEGMLTPTLLRPLVPLFDRDMPADKRLRFSREFSGYHTDTAAFLQASLAEPGDPGLRAIVSFALGEIAPPPPPDVVQAHKAKTQAMKAISVQDAPPPPVEPTAPPTERRRRAPADLLGALSGDSGPAKPDVKSEDEPQAPAPQPSTPEAKQADFKMAAFLSGKSAAPLPAAEPIKAAEPAKPLTAVQRLFSRDQIQAMLKISAGSDPAPEVRAAASAALRMTEGLTLTEIFQAQEGTMLSTIEKIIFLKEVSFFEGMTVDQLKILAGVAEEQVFNEEAVIYPEGAPGGVLYVIVRGRIALEREGQRKGSYSRIATLNTYGYFGENTLFDSSPSTERAIAVQDTLMLSLRREPLLELMRRNPDLSLKLINVLSRRLREATDRIAQLSSTRPRELHKLFDKLE